MVKNIILLAGFSLLIPLVAYPQVNIDPRVWYKPPMLPISLSWGNNGIQLKIDRSVNTPLGTFGVSVSGGIKKENENSVRIIEKTIEKPIYIEIPKYIYKDRVVVKEKPIIKIKEVERIEIVEKKFYIVELRNYKGNKRQEFIISGLDVFSVEAEGKTKIEAHEGRIIIDVLESNITELSFRGGVFEAENFSDEIVKICLKYNRDFIVHKSNFVGFMVNPLDAENQEDLWKKETARQLITVFNVTNFKDHPVAFYRKMLVTEKGIGFLGREEKERLLPFKKKKKFGKKTTPLFFNWPEFLKLTFVKEDEKYNIRVIDHYGKAYLMHVSGVFTNTHIIRFLKELNDHISSNVK